jgi:integrase
MKRHSDADINRRNWLHTRAYLTYCVEVKQLQDISAHRAALDHLLRWATDISLSNAPDIRPTFPVYLNEATQGQPSYIKKILATVRRYFLWARDRFPDQYDRINYTYLDTLITRKQPGRVAEREVFDVEAVRAIVTAIPTERRIDRRDRAAIAFLFLSGMRASAFCSLPVKAVDLSVSPALIRQWPDWGVRTKFGKAANTTLLPEAELPDLWAIVSGWDTEVRAQGDAMMWFALLTPTGEWDADQHPGEHRDGDLRRDLARLCKAARVPYLSPHKLRRGHIVWASEHCSTTADYVAVQQNVMHESASMTLAYNQLPEAEARRRIAGLVKQGEELTKEELVERLTAALFGSQVARDRA